jgi:hypothetical protein
MAPAEMPRTAREFDPVEHITGTLQAVWIDLCKPFDVSTCMPELELLFMNVDLSEPGEAAENVLALMLLEVMESVSRFSPWYRRPARAFGVVSMRDAISNNSRWLLAPEAVLRWEEVLKKLRRLVRRYSGLIHAMILMDSLVADLPDDPSVSASCACLPPRRIHLRLSILKQSEITCEACLHPYAQSEEMGE